MEMNLRPRARLFRRLPWLHLPIPPRRPLVLAMVLVVSMALIMVVVEVELSATPTKLGFVILIPVTLLVLVSVVVNGLVRLCGPTLVPPVSRTVTPEV